MSERRLEETEEMAGSGERGRGTAQALMPHLSDRLDTIPEDHRESMLVKAYLLLAEAHGDLATAVACLEDAARIGHGARDDGL
ncbi:hypothetical protein [Salinarimonas ramus]|uniref:Uncharacterized protein n=1 Tax=Salinarimonas ramus TaxID=690164 RepID=A0A917QGL1_9HYPH|nr:hypothetical protein [Salinarimonas ramus]GGK49649.1 hypothetical protein GCM10011322_40820 [Salinarimonas ramus]